MIFTLLVVFGVFLFLRNTLEGQAQELTVSEIQAAANAGHIEEISYVLVGGDNFDLVEVSGKIYDQHKGLYDNIVTFERIMRIDQAQEIMNVVEGYGGKTNVNTRSGITFWTVLLNLFPIALFIVILFIIFRNANSSNNRAFDFAKNRAKLNREKGVTFKDVAGCDEEKEELEEIIDFLKAPKKYVDMGARIPKGVLLVGAPGTGKTLLARAVSGEANVPFFSISGSDFVEMFVGVGASRVRDLFKVAKENSPCILFIDEIDAVGRQRGAGLGGGHDEREQTLNQLLVEMDGFSTNLGIIIMAATNRPDVLDPALLRPGRFDRQVTIDLPDVRGREAILKVHARNKKLDPNVKLGEVAHRIPGFSGADIENLLNEAALLAARDNRTLVAEQDLDEAMDRVRMGPAKKSKKFTKQEKRTIAYHEAGHAVIGLKLDYANVVQKVTIIPRGRAGGYNLMVPSEERFLETKQSLLAMITSYLGGRVAEEIMFDTVTTGAYNDFQMATSIARAMVTEYGMSDLGPIQYENQGGNVFLGRDYFKEKNFSDQVAHEIDKEVRNIITICFEKAREIITANKDLLDTIAKYLLEVETLTKADIDELVETGKLSWWSEKKELNGNAA
ncbi:MAG: ATP-dependent zinc metalloprotease FtsH [Acholeplasmataceae bacterium]|nr:MAG: ATP-dependent zinc metalloprotease FtsH [Acholeplasmataceae bacterium]